MADTSHPFLNFVTIYFLLSSFACLSFAVTIQCPSSAKEMKDVPFPLPEKVKIENNYKVSFLKNNYIYFKCC